jgi:hypothetical protein
MLRSLEEAVSGRHWSGRQGFAAARALADTLELISVRCPSDDIDEYTKISWEDVQVPMEAFARCGGEPEIRYML